MKTSLVVTVFNEEKSIEEFIKSVLSQGRLPDEIIIVDGGSSDQTAAKVKNSCEAGSRFARQISNKKLKFKFFIKKGNRSVGRNEGIRIATGNIVLSTDAGCILDKRWVEKIIEPFEDRNVDVVAGYYKGRARSTFQKSLVPYVLVMPDKVDPKEFLPATRTMAFKKSIWKKVGGFDEQLSHNEDYVFANKLKKIGAKMVFKKDAIVEWIPQNTYKEAFVMFFRFALGDAESGIGRTSVLLLFARYFLCIYFLFLSFLYKSFIPFIVIIVSFIFYILWSIKKNYRYVGDKRAIKILPLLQLTADGAVLSGTIIGLLKVIKRFNYFFYAKRNKFLLFILSVYIGVMLLTLNWGAPNEFHPFPYHMDEWHQLNAVRATFAYGTPNIPGAANGTMLHFLLSGLYLVPFKLIGWINPVTIEINDFVNRARIFDLLRLNTIFWGVLSVFLVYKIAVYTQASKKLTIIFFTFSPIWLTLNGYFKYDIALIFWILLSVLFFVRYVKNPNGKNFLLAAIPTSLAVSVKVSAAPLFLLYILLYLMFGKLKNVRHLFLGAIMCAFLVLFFGMPDTVFGKGNILDYLYDNIVRTPNYSGNYILNMHPYQYLMLKHYPILFGYGLLLLFVICLVSQIAYVKKGLSYFWQTQKMLIFLIVSFFVFLASILPLQIFAGGNRSLVLLPFMVLIISLICKNFKYRSILIGIISILIAVQIYQSFAWLYIKYLKSPQESASSWIIGNIKKGEKIGIENIPIYQMLPDIIQKEYYFSQYERGQNNLYRYEIIDNNTKNLPNTIVLTNSDIEAKLLRASPKKNITRRLEKEGYKKTKVFMPDLTYFKAIGSDEDFYLSGLLVASPLTISVFEK